MRILPQLGEPCPRLPLVERGQLWSFLCQPLFPAARKPYTRKQSAKALRTPVSNNFLLCSKDQPELLGLE
jgi:hypothetical protein